MKVYTYFDQDPTLTQFNDVLNIWKDSWSKHGWEPVVLPRRIAGMHPLCAQVEMHIGRLPTVNPKKYTINNFLRWLAMDVVGGGLHVDSDVVNYGYKPPTKPTGTQRTKAQLRPAVTTILDKGKVPCAVWTVPGNNFAKRFLEIKESSLLELNGQKHNCDMPWFQKQPFETLDVVKEPSETSDDWKEAQLVHFASGAISKFGFSKSTYATAVEVLRPV